MPWWFGFAYLAIVLAVDFVAPTVYVLVILVLSLIDERR